MGNMHRITRHVPAGLCRGRYAIYIRSCNAFQGKESKKSSQMEVFPLCFFGVPIMRIVVCCVLYCGHPIYGNCQIYSPQKEQQKKQAQSVVISIVVLRSWQWLRSGHALPTKRGHMRFGRHLDYYSGCL